MLAKTISAHIFFTRSTQTRDNEDCTAPHYVAIRHPYVAPTTRVPGKKKNIIAIFPTGPRAVSFHEVCFIITVIC